MGWLADQFGIDKLRKAEVVLPTEQYFPDAYEATPEGAALMYRVCGYMGVTAAEVEFQVHADDEMPGAAGRFEPGLIRIAASQLDDAQSLVATVGTSWAEYLARRKLLADELDREWVTDLLPVFGPWLVFGECDVAGELPAHGTPELVADPQARLSFGADDRLRLGHVRVDAQRARPAWAEHLPWTRRTRCGAACAISTPRKIPPSIRSGPGRGRPAYRLPARRTNRRGHAVGMRGRPLGACPAGHGGGQRAWTPCAAVCRTAKPASVPKRPGRWPRWDRSASPRCLDFWKPCRTSTPTSVPPRRMPSASW